jgi:hypothetical protein
MTTFSVWQWFTWHNISKHPSFGNCKKHFFFSVKVERSSLVTGTGSTSAWKVKFANWYVLNLLRVSMKASFFSLRASSGIAPRAHFIKDLWNFFGQWWLSKNLQTWNYKIWSGVTLSHMPGDGGSPRKSWLLAKFNEQINYGTDILWLMHL